MHLGCFVSTILTILNFKNVCRRAKKEKRRSSLGRGRISIGPPSELNASADEKGVDPFSLSFVCFQAVICRDAPFQ